MSDEPDGGFWPYHHPLRRIERKLDLVLDQMKELKMSESQLETDLTAQTAAVQALASEVTNGLQANATAIAALQAQVAAGTPVTAADLSTLESNTAAMITATNQLQATLNPAPPTPPAGP